MKRIYQFFCGAFTGHWPARSVRRFEIVKEGPSHFSGRNYDICGICEKRL